MSWADDNLMYEEEPDYSWLEEAWEKGEHQDRAGNQYKLSEMTDSHLINTIKLFEDVADTYKLKEELKRRKIIK